MDGYPRTSDTEPNDAEPAKKMQYNVHQLNENTSTTSIS